MGFDTRGDKMEQITKEAWLNALLPIHNGGRLNQLLSVMTGGNIQYIEWLMNMGLDTMQVAEQAETIQQVLANAQVNSQFVVPALPWQGAGILHTAEGETGLMVISAYAALEDFHQEELQAKRLLHKSTDCHCYSKKVAYFTP